VISLEVILFASFQKDGGLFANSSAKDRSKNFCLFCRLTFCLSFLFSQGGKAKRVQSRASLLRVDANRIENDELLFKIGSLICFRQQITRKGKPTTQPTIYQLLNQRNLNHIGLTFFLYRNGRCIDHHLARFD
jgi:hypothetical protein